MECGLRLRVGRFICSGEQNKTYQRHIYIQVHTHRCLMLGVLKELRAKQSTWSMCHENEHVHMLITDNGEDASSYLCGRLQERL